MLFNVKVKSRKVTDIYGKEGFKFYILNLGLQTEVGIDNYWPFVCFTSHLWVYLPEIILFACKSTLFKITFEISNWSFYNEKIELSCGHICCYFSWFIFELNTFKIFTRNSSNIKPPRKLTKMWIC